MVKLASSSTPLLLVLIVVHLAVPPSTADPDPPNQLYIYYCDNDSGNYTSDSAYKTNLDSLLTKLTTTNNSFGFYNFSAGDQTPDVVYLTSLCRGDVSVSDCHSCQDYIIGNRISKCPNQKNAILWNNDCMIRYSKDSILGILEDDDTWGGYMKSDNVTSDPMYDLVVNNLVESLPSRASDGNSSLKFATAHSVYNSTIITLYSAAQCTPDLTQDDCLQCLTKAVNRLEARSTGKRGARYLYPSCHVRYEEHMFYSSSYDPLVTYPPIVVDFSHEKRRSKTKIIVAVVAGTLCIALIVVACCIFIRKRKLHWNKLSKNFIHGDDDISNVESLQYKFNTIKEATGNFSEANKLGEGGFGAVYKGKLPNNGKEIAVKRLAGNSSQGEVEFKNEVTLLAKLQHRNLVRLLGFCIHNKERLLIYEFVPNASLDNFLFGTNRRPHLGWENRYKIIRGIARGILYLHEDSRLRVIHRDLKANNVLLDAEMHPKIADFGTARLFEIDQTHSDTSRIAGTYGYMAPEYVLHGNFSVKSDVYSFGVLLLEIVCGKRCNTLFTGEFSGSLINLIWRKWSEGTPLEVVDSNISDGSESEILRCIHIGLLCIQDNMVERPTMSSVVLMMSSASIVLPLPSQPAYIITSNMPLNTEDANWSVDKSTELESITELRMR